MINSHWCIKIVMQKGDKFHTDYQYVKTHRDIARLILTYKPKRGYHIIQIDCQEDSNLFDFID